MHTAGNHSRQKMDDSDMSDDSEEYEVEEDERRRSDDISDEDYRSSEDFEDDQDGIAVWYSWMFWWWVLLHGLVATGFHLEVEAPGILQTWSVQA